ncbi:tyrosine--tRNA ligase [Marinicauda salina]|uniref:Tyrosine--tRNA ligase n=1 Tax=Marinicauda salina TaxID=2135793 RepID=A0A2U2BTF9_9PROT|nr:tyrosine--tRNA ligase [Marinicauda salina]PWE17301.1 tyrosine--tRNA ligase [Marinicauda salina]
MTDTKSDLVSALVERGYVNQATDLDGLDAAAAKAPVTGYIGFDLTAPSLHVGSLVQIMMLRRMQQAGHRPIVLFGGATTKIGDPSGKDSARPLLTPEQIAVHKEGILKPFSRLLDLDACLVVDNDEWLAGYGYLEFLREYGRHFTINRMLTFDSVRLRLEREQPMTFLEFNYMLLQAVDFLELNRRHDCTLQIGGQDQWGNIVNGVELCRRVDGVEVYGLTTPLITTASGAKMGKTAEGAVWLNEDLLSAYDYWQFWRNTEDADVGRFLRLFTDLPLDEIARLESLGGAEINAAKVALANAATTMLHGEQAARDAEETAKATFAGGAGAGLPTVEIDAAAFERGEAGLVAALADAGLCASRGEARRKIKEGAARVNDAVVDDPQRALSAEDLRDGAIKLSVGKKRHALVRPV